MEACSIESTRGFYKLKKRKIVAPEAKTIKQLDLNENESSEGETPLQRDQLNAHKRALARYDSKRQATSPVEELAGDVSGLTRNVKFPGADEAYPQVQQWAFRFVSAFYPNAKGGPLYVDQPRNEAEVYRAYERQKVMKKLKLRHIVVENNSSFVDLLEQLGEM